MNKHLVLHDLGDRGRHWVSRCLASGKGLSTHLAPLVDLNNGTTFLLGSEASGIDETELEHGIVGSFLSPEISAQALIDVSEHLRQDSDSLLLVAEDDLRQPQDPAVVKEDHGSIVIAGGTVYHWTELPDDYSAQGLAEFLGRSSSGYPLNAFVFPDLSAQRFIETAEDDIMLGDVAKGLICIVNSVFDADAYCAWIPSPLISSVLRE